jgi:hypothetical protein
MMNLVLAIFLSMDNNTDQCVWYFVNILVDTTLGVFICFLMMLVIDKMARHKDWKVNFIFKLFYEMNKIEFQYYFYHRQFNQGFIMKSTKKTGKKRPD